MDEDEGKEMKGREERGEKSAQSVRIERASERRTVHEDCLCDIVGIVASNDMVNRQNVSSSVESLSSEDTAVCTYQTRVCGSVPFRLIKGVGTRLTVSFLSHFCYNFVHRPTLVKLRV